MESSFRPQILVDKLSKLNSSQQSIETLSHWCIFHMNKAKHVVETWEKQFHCAPREQRVSFLYLANDIIQNSRRKGTEFVAEFWKVLPGALHDVIANGDDFGKNAALRLISIWEERKVFGSKGQMRKDDFLKKPLDNGNRHWNSVGVTLSQGGNTLDKLVSSYHAVRGCKIDVDAIINKCKNSASFINKVELDIEHDYVLGNINSGITTELKEQCATLSKCIEQLGVVESSRSNLVFLLREALQEQEYKLDQIRHHLQEAQKHSERAETICSRLLDRSSATPVLREPSVPHPAPPQMPSDFVPGPVEQVAPVIQTRQATSFAENSGPIEDPKSAAAAVAAKLATSTSSAQMLTLVLSSLASEGVISNSIQDTTSDYPWEKRTKLEGEHPCYVPRNSDAPDHTTFLPPPPPPQLPPVSSQELYHNNIPPPPPTSPPPSAPLPPSLHQHYSVPEYIPSAMPMLSGKYGYNVSQQEASPPIHSSYLPPVVETHPAAEMYQTYATTEVFYEQSSSSPTVYRRGQ